MKAYRNVAGNVVEVEVDVGIDGQPILPPDTTTDERPEAQEGHYVTVVGKVWVQIPIPQPFTSFETKKAEALVKMRKYRDWYLEQPVEHSGVKFDGDDIARARLTQALVINTANGYLPPAWVAYDNSLFPIADLAALQALVNTVQVAFSNRFFEMSTLRDQITAAADETALTAITIPSVPQDGLIPA